MDLVQRRQQLRQKQVDKVKKFRDSAAETAAYQKKKESEVKTKSKSSGSRLVPKISTKTKPSIDREKLKKEIKAELSTKSKSSNAIKSTNKKPQPQTESLNISDSNGTTFARVMDIIGPAHMKPLVSNGVWKGTEQITEKKSDCECDDCGQDPCIECGESHHKVNEQVTDDDNIETDNAQQKKQIDSKQKKADQIKKQVLLKKIQAVRQGGGEDIVASYDWRSDDSMRINRIFEGKKKGLWDNIHAKRKRGEKPAKPGDKDYPKTLDVDEGLKQARKNVGADTCWDGYTAKGTKKKGGKEVPNCVKEDGVSEGAAWTKKSGKSASGGLNEKGRKSYERENPGSDLKAPQPEGGSRKKSFCARMGGMKKKLTSSKTANDPDSRINKALRKWKC